MTAGTRIFMGNHIWLAKRGDEQSAAGRQAAQQDSGSERANRDMHLPWAGYGQVRYRCRERQDRYRQTQRTAAHTAMSEWVWSGTARGPRSLTIEAEMRIV
ncbi:hypothetical protein CTA2_8035 [Colletotrichum tanaceti]|nr:hypothetical protein CTA2_8035 [Colletotrichum tanaceti]